MRMHGRAHVNKCMGVNFNVFMHTQINYTILKIFIFGFMETWMEHDTVAEKRICVSEGALRQKLTLWHQSAREPLSKGTL